MTSPPDRWVSFYSDCFPSEAETHRFIEACRGDTPEASVAKDLMQHSRRLILLADDMSRSKPGRDALPVLFFVICAEFVAKKVDGATKPGQSSHYVQQFFSRFLTPREQQEIASAFKAKDGTAFDLRQSVSILYKVRCKVAHEGVYWEFSFSRRNHGADYVPEAEANLTLAKLRGIMKRGCARAALAVLGGTDDDQAPYRPRPFDHDLEKSELFKEQQRHRTFLGRSFTPRCPSTDFSDAEWTELRRRGAWLEALSSGTIRPITALQRRFVDTCEGRIVPAHPHEELWERYTTQEAYFRLLSLPSEWDTHEDHSYDQYDHEEFYDDEADLLRSELASDADSWARSGDEGWYYEDDDGDEYGDTEVDDSYE